MTSSHDPNETGQPPLVPKPEPIADPPPVGEPPVGPISGPIGEPPVEPISGPVGRPPVEPIGPPVSPPAGVGSGGVGSGGAGGGRVHVEPLHLSGAGQKANRIGDDMMQTVRGQFDGLGRSGQPDGWALSSALNDCAGRWEQQLTATAQTIHGVGDRLNTTADNYVAADQANAERFREINPSA